MDFKLTEEQELLLESLQELLDREAPESYVAECDARHEPPIRLKKALREAGFNSIGFPEEYGGTPVDTVTMCLIAEKCGAHGVRHAWGPQVVPIKDILMFGSEEQKQAILDCVKEGQTPFCLGITEPGAGSDITSLRTTATRRGDGTVVFNGQKTFSTWAGVAKYCLLMTRDPENPKPHRAMSMWLVPMDTPGITVNPLHKIAWWMSDSCEIFLDNVVAPESCLVGQEGNGFMQLMANFEVERLMIVAGACGQAQAAFHDAARYANQRIQFGEPIGSFQQIQLKLANMAVKIENMRNMIYRCAWMVDQGMPVQKESAMAKLYCAQASWEVVDDALQIYGGLGFTMDCRMQRLWRDMRLDRVAGGTDEIMVNIVGKQVLKEHR